MVPFTLAGKLQIFPKDFTKEWLEYSIALVSIVITKELFYKAIANTQCMRILRHC